MMQWQQQMTEQGGPYGGGDWSGMKPFGERPTWQGGPQTDPSYYMDMGQQFDAAKGFLMDQTGPGGMLSEASMNPYTRQLAEGSAYAERERRSNMGYDMASAGVNPLMAKMAIGEGNQMAQEQLGTQFAGFQQGLQDKQFMAGAGLVDLNNALVGDMTGRKEDQWRWGQEYALAQQNNQAMSGAAKDQASATQQAGWLSFFGGMLCDRRLKKNIKPVGVHPNGLMRIYEFSYLWEDKLRTGVMADEVELVAPEAITTIGDYKFVHYDRL